MVRFECRLDDSFHLAHAQRPLYDGALAESALPRAAAHYFDRDPIVDAFHKRQNRRSGQWRRVQIADYRRLDRFGNVASRAIDRGDSAVGEVFRLIESRDIYE